MAARATGGSGNWSSTVVNAPWTTGVVPVLGDSVTISSGHTVTLDGVYTVGNDSGSAFSLGAGGILKASRAVTSGLTVRGAFSGTGTLDCGTEADPIPAAYTCTMTGNDSAAMAANKFGFGLTGAGKVYSWGATRTRLTTLSASAAAAATTFTVTDVTGWAIGDFLVFGPPDNTSTTVTARAITGVSGNDITVGAALSEASSAGRYVSNVSSNVRFVSKTPETYTSTCFTILNTTAANAIEVGQTEFVACPPSFGTGSLKLFATFEGGIKKIDSIAVHNIASISGSTVTATASGTNPIYSSFDFNRNGTGSNIVAASVGAVAGSVGISVVSYAELVNPAALGFAYPFSNAQAALLGCEITNPYVLGVSGSFIGYNSTSASTASAYNLDVIGGTCVGLATVYGSRTQNQAKVVFSGTDFGGGSTGVAGMSSGITFQSALTSPITDTLFDTCLFPSNFAVARTAIIEYLANTSQVVLYSPNNDTTDQRRYVNGGEMIRENSIVKHGTSSVRMDCWFAANTQTYSFTIPVSAGQTITLLGAMRYTTTYGVGTPATVTISGLGITPVVETCPTSGVDTWYDYSISATNSQAYAGNFTVTYAGKSSADSTGAYCYFDGVPDIPWVENVRHYGYEFDANAYRTVDPYITETTEATAGAYTGISISGSTITLSSTHSIQELYDYCKWYLCQTANLGVADFFSTSDGINFSSAYNITINTGVSLTGTGAITITGGKILTMTGTATSSLDITHTSGTKVWTRMAFSGLTANSRVQLYDTNTTTELYNAVVAGTSLEYQQNWTADHTIRYRISYVNGATAKNFIEASTTFTSSGLSVGVAQTDDAVYIANAVVGSTITGITITPSPARVKINLAGGTVPWKDIYAYQCYWLYGAAGIADEAAFIIATDTANYILTGFDIRNDSTTPLTITGGWGKDSITDTIAGVIDVAGSVGNIYAEPDHIIPYNAGTADALTVAKFIALK